MTFRDIYGHNQPMKILLTTPSVNSVNGGIYIIIQWCNKLKSLYGHDVTLFTENSKERRCEWRRLEVPIVHEFKRGHYDVVIICSPHSIWIEDLLTTEKGFLFCQMHEALFKPDDQRWQAMCLKFYKSALPMFSISQWNIEAFQEMCRHGKSYYIGNGIDFKDFPIEHPTKDGTTVLLESPESKNPTKDSDKLALRLAGELKQKGYRVIGYGAQPLRPHDRGVINYVLNPSLAKINELYSQATVMVKATKFDARSLSPLEAMTKGCSVSRAIGYGDDDLTDGFNCVRTTYDYESLKEQTLMLLENHEYRKKIVENAYLYIQEQTWQKHLEPVNNILCT